MLTQADITLIIAALQFWAEEMDPQDEQCLRIYAEVPEAEQSWTPAEIQRLRSRLKTAGLKYVISDESGTTLENKELHSTIQSAFKIRSNSTHLIGTLLLPALRPNLQWGIQLALDAANEDFKESFTRDLLIETTGAEDQMLKYLPSPQIEELILREGLEINRECLIKLVENLDR